MTLITRTPRWVASRLLAWIAARLSRIPARLLLLLSRVAAWLLLLLPRITARLASSVVAASIASRILLARWWLAITSRLLVSHWWRFEEEN